MDGVWIEHWDVLYQNVQNIRRRERLVDFLQDMDGIDFDLAFLSETGGALIPNLWLPNVATNFLWRDLLAIVVLALSQALLQRSPHIVFHTLASRVSVFHFDIRDWETLFSAIAYYCPASWATAEAVEGQHVP